MQAIHSENDHTHTDPALSGGAKWRRRGDERRGSKRESSDYIEKRSSGDRRTHLLKQVSKIIFPRGKDGYGY
jgi:hypothetical protein